MTTFFTQLVTQWELEKRLFAYWTTQSDNYSLVQTEMIEMFDVLKNHEVCEQFLQKFKQAHTETVTSFFMKYQSQSQHLVSRGIWPDDISNKFNELAFFRAKLKTDVSLQVSLLMQQQCISETD